MQKIRSRGFTLIELLVVIAIIGILSAVVLASLTTARSKGSDAAIQSDLASIQAQAELTYMTGNTYINTCEDTIVDRAVDAADAANGSGGSICTDSAAAYAVITQLVAVPADSWCVDSTGNSKREVGVTASAITVCP